jgi:hypothetical protein
LFAFFKDSLLKWLDDFFFALNLVFQVYDISLELNDPGFSLCDFLVQLTNLSL